MKEENNDHSNKLESIRLLLCVIIGILLYMSMGDKLLQFFNL
jgi:hypothetical protein